MRNKIGKVCFNEAVRIVNENIKATVPFILDTEFGRYLVKFRGVSQTMNTHRYTEWRYVNASKETMDYLRDPSIVAYLEIDTSSNPKIQLIMIVRALSDAICRYVSMYHSGYYADPIAAYWLYNHTPWAKDYGTFTLSEDFLNGLGDISIGNNRKNNLLHHFVSDYFHELSSNIKRDMEKLEDYITGLEEKMKKEKEPVWYPSGLTDFYHVLLGVTMAGGYQREEVIEGIRRVNRYRGDLLPAKVVKEIVRPKETAEKKSKHDDHN